MFYRLLLLAALVVAAPAAAQLPCANPAADPCVLGSTVTIPVGIYDIRPKSLSVANKQITVSGAGELRILAANVIFQPGARFIATGTDGNTTVTLEATGSIDLQSQGTSKSKIDVSGNFGGGTINLHSVGNLSVNGTLVSNATNLTGYGGPINLKSDTGNITITGDPSEGVKSFGNAQGGGGSINVDATLGSVSVSTQLVPKGGDCGSCEVNLNAGANITTTAQGVIDMRASGIGDAGFFSASAGGDINLAGNILANGSSDELEGGTGGDVLISANGSVTVGGRIELNGAGQDAAPGSMTGSVDGDGGTLDVSAGTTIQMNGPMFGISKGFGQGDEFSFDAIGNVTIAAEIDMTGDNFGGDITVLSDGLITVSARIRTATPIDPVNKPGSLGGTIDLEGCQINVAAAGQVIATGPGGVPSGANYLAAATGITIVGQLTATAENELRWRTTAPVVSGLVAPPQTLVNDLLLTCCGVSCPTTTTTSTSTSTTTLKPTTTTSTSTSTSTTSSTITLPPTTSSTSAPGPTTTTTTVAGPTTTTSSTSSSTLISTTSTSAASSSTLASTTSSTTVIPTTSTSIAGATTSTSTVTVPPTTSTTSPPLTCLDTAVGIDAVRCRLDTMSDLMGHASEADLGGRKLARALSVRISKAKTLAADPPKTPRLKKATKQLKGFAIKLGKAVAAGKANATLGAELDGLATQAQTELAGLTT